MTRKRIVDHLKKSIAEQGIECDEKNKAVADAAIDATLDYLIDFGMEVSQELVGVGLYSESMIAGLFIRKIKNLRHL